MGGDGSAIAVAQGRARAASAVLGFIAIEQAAAFTFTLASVVGVLVPIRDMAGAMYAIASYVNCMEGLATIVCCVLFLRWVNAAFRAALEVDARPVRFSAIHATLCFFIPLLNLIRPYQALRALNVAVDPARLPDPPPRAQSGEHPLGYREPAAAPAVASTVPPPPLLAWWVLWLAPVVPTVLGFAVMDSWIAARSFASMHQAINAVDALLAALVVRRITARLAAYASKSGLANADRELAWVATG
jgi:hypothetical protein